MEWWRSAFPPRTEAPEPEVLALRLVVAFALGCVVAAIHHYTSRKSTNEATSLTATLVLLSILIAMVTQVIGNSVERAFTLVGALAIVRFRTIVEDTRDTAFVIFAVIVGMACGAGQLPGAAIGIGVVGVAAFALRQRPRDAAEFTLVVRVGLREGIETVLEKVLGNHVERAVLTETSTARQGAALELTWLVRLRPSTRPLALVGELNQLEGVQGVELKR